MASFGTRRQTQFVETDAAGIVHFSHYARFVEEAEHVFLEKAGFPIDLHSPEALRWPRVRFLVSCLHPLTPMEWIRVELTPGRVGRSSLTWNWSIQGERSGNVAARGEMKTVCTEWVDGTLRARPIPEELRKRLNAI